MRSFTNDALASLQGVEPVRRGMIRFDLASGSYGFWDGAEPYTFEDCVYQPGGQLLQIDAIPGGIGTESQGITVRLSAIANTDLTPDVLATIENEQYIGRRVTIHSMYLSPDGALLEIVRIYRGYCDKLVHEETDGGEAAIVASIESKSLDNQKRGYRVRSSNDQARINPGDEGLEHVAVASTYEIFWGKNPPASLNGNTTSGRGGFGREAGSFG
jgi:hypothetical protein